MEEDYINNSWCVEMICVDPSTARRGVLYVPLLGGMLVGLLVLDMINILSNNL